MSYLRIYWFQILAAILLLVALGDHPYSYFQILRWFVAAAAAYSAYTAFTKQKQAWAWIFVVVAVLFNPIAPFYLSREEWANLDILAAAVFICSSFAKTLS